MSALTGESLPVLRSRRGRRGRRPCRWTPETWCSVARTAPAARRARGRTRPGCAPSSGESRRCRSGCGRGEPAGATGAAGRVAHRRDRGGHGRRVPAVAMLGAGLRWPTRSSSRSACWWRTCPRGCCRPSHSRWRSASGSWRGAVPSSSGWRRRDAGVDDGDLHRQDRHADREPDDGDRVAAGAERTVDAGDGRARSSPRRRGVHDRRRQRGAPRHRRPHRAGPAATPPRALGAAVDPAERDAAAGTCSTSTRALQLMSTVDDRDGGDVGRTSRAHPRPCCRGARRRAAARDAAPLDDRRRARARPARRGARRRGLRVLAVAAPATADGGRLPAAARRPSATSVLLGLVAHARPAAARGRRRGRRAATRPASGSSWSPATTASPRPRSPGRSASAASTRRS